jgi:hypothetical protein
VKYNEVGGGIVRYLRDVLRDYKAWAKPLVRIVDQGTQHLDIGDVVAIYGDDIVYGVVFDKVDNYYNVIFLTTELLLGGNGYKVAINHLVDSAKVTPINFYVKPECCEVVRKLSQDEFQQVVDSFEKLSHRQYKGIWQEFYTFETQRLQVLYDTFLNDVINR